MLWSVLASSKLICFGRKYKFFTFHKNKAEVFKALFKPRYCYKV